MYGSVTSVHIYRSYLPKVERNNFLSKILWKFTLEKKGWSCVVNVATALVSMVLPDRIKILISIIEYLGLNDCLMVSLW